VYFSASWCPPCKKFTPKLITFRNENQKDFEVIFVSLDKTEKNMFDYIEHAQMPWPLCPFKDARQLAQQAGISIIPTLVILSREGKFITDWGRSAITTNYANCIDLWREGYWGGSYFGFLFPSSW